VSKVSIGQPAANTPEAKLDWCIQALKRLEQAMNVSLLEATADNFTFSNVTETRTLDVSTAGDADIANVIATFVGDIKRRGAKSRSA
jgi:hypothetical protein